MEIPAAQLAVPQPAMCTATVDEFATIVERSEVAVSAEPDSSADGGLHENLA